MGQRSSTSANVSSEPTVPGSLVHVNTFTDLGLIESSDNPRRVTTSIEVDVGEIVVFLGTIAIGNLVVADVLSRLGRGWLYLEEIARIDV